MGMTQGRIKSAKLVRFFLSIEYSVCIDASYECSVCTSVQKCGYQCNVCVCVCSNIHQHNTSEFVFFWTCSTVVCYVVMPMVWNGAVPGSSGYVHVLVLVLPCQGMRPRSRTDYDAYSDYLH